MKYWLISAPGDKTKQQTWQKLNDKTAVQNSYSINFKFDIPDLKVRVFVFGLKSKPHTPSNACRRSEPLIL